MIFHLYRAVRHLGGASILLALAVAPAAAAVFQYTVPVTTAGGPSAAYLWIPPAARQVRGVVIGGMTLMEREFARDPHVRQACTQERLAVVFLKCGLGATDPQKVLDDLAEASGYRELPVAPLMFVGHSAGGPQAKACTARMAARCFGLVLYRGGVPGGSEAVPPGVPVLMMLGQFDEFGGTMRNESGREAWMEGRDALAAFRAGDERNLGSLVVEPGAGHFAWSDRNAAYLALFIHKAAQARIPATWPLDASNPITLPKIEPRDGWLTDLGIEAESPHPPAPYGQYRGDKAKAAWHFDKQMAQATLAYHAAQFRKKDQFIKWNDPYWVDAGARFFFTRLTWVADGQTFEVHPVYADKYPAQYQGRGPVWPQAGNPVGRSPTPILVKPVGGPVVSTGTNALRIQYHNLAPATENSRVTFMAYSRGDAQYRYTEQVGMMPRGFRGLDRGKPQVITFPPPKSLRADSGPVELKATSDSGLPVEYYVAYGPATIADGMLKIAEMPARATFPITVEIVAFQFGRGVEPLIQTAKPVVHTVQIRK